MSELHERDAVFNVVWTGTVFTHLQWFVASQIAQSQARYRFVVNGCPPEQVALMERFAEAHPEGVEEILVVSEPMVRHGDAIDAVLERRHDGPLFGLIDPDIIALGPFAGRLVELLDDAAAATSGTEVWSEDNLVPEGHPGVSGEYFFGRDGFVWGTAHLALYRRDDLDAMRERWGVGFSWAGQELSDEARGRLEALGQRYLIHDTGKLVNAFLQVEGHRVVHEELDSIVHVGGLAHHLSPTGYTTSEDGTSEPDWATWRGMTTRYEVTRHVAQVLQALVAGREPPPLPQGLEPGLAERLAAARSAIEAVVPSGAGEVAP